MKPLVEKPLVVHRPLVIVHTYMGNASPEIRITLAEEAIGRVLDPVVTFHLHTDAAVQVAHALLEAVAVRQKNGVGKE